MSETKPHILMIDDDPSILEMMHQVLQEEGRYQITTTEIVFEDVAEVERVQPDLILLDFLMQGRQCDSRHKMAGAAKIWRFWRFPQYVFPNTLLVIDRLIS